MKRVAALGMALVFAMPIAADARGGRGGGGMRGGGGRMSMPSRPATMPSRPSMPSGGFGNGFNGDFSNRAPVNPGGPRPSNPIANPGRPGDIGGPGGPGGAGGPGRPGNRPPGSRPPIQPPVPPQPGYGWNGGVAWYPAPLYYGGGFWGPYAWGFTTAIVLGSVEDEETKEDVKSYQVAPDSPGAKVLEAYKLTQVECKAENTVIIFGPENSVVCAAPNEIVSAGKYDLSVDDLTIYSREPVTK